MAVLTQLVKGDILAKLNETQITILNSHIEAELLQNAAVRQALTQKAGEILKTLGH